PVRLRSTMSTRTGPTPVELREERTEPVRVLMVDRNRTGRLRHRRSPERKTTPGRRGQRRYYRRRRSIRLQIEGTDALAQPLAVHPVDRLAQRLQPAERRDLVGLNLHRPVEV